jgi:hypothetical protein
LSVDNDYLRAIREKIGGVELKRPYTSERDDWIQFMVLAGLGFTGITRSMTDR